MTAFVVFCNEAINVYSIVTKNKGKIERYFFNEVRGFYNVGESHSSDNCFIHRSRLFYDQNHRENFPGSGIVIHYFCYTH